MSGRAGRPWLLSSSIALAAFASGCGSVGSEAFNGPSGPPGDDSAIVVADSSSDDVVAVDSSGPPTDTNVDKDTAVDKDTTPPPPVDSGPPPGDDCGSPIALVASPTAAEAKGDTTADHDDFPTLGCSASPGNDVVYSIAHPGGDLELETYGSSIDSVIALLSDCATPTSERACSHRTSSGAGSSRIIYRALEKKGFFVVVDSSVAGGGAYRLGYRAADNPAQLTCDSTPLVISDGAAGAMGVDLFDKVSTSGMSSNTELRPFPGKDVCTTASGSNGFGQGSDQVYRLDLKERRTLKITPHAISPAAFSVGGGAARFDLLAYLRDAEGPPSSDEVANCKQSSSTTVSDRCITFGTEMTVDAGSYWLILDSISGSNGRYHLHIDIK